MNKKVSLNSSIFSEAVAAGNEVIQEAIEQLQSGNFSKVDVTLKLAIKPVYKDEEQMLVQVDHKESYTCKKERKEKGTSASDSPIKKVGEEYVQGENPQKSLFEEAEKDE